VAGGEDITSGGDVTLVAHTRKVAVCVPHDGGWEDWWRGGMVRYTPGGTAPPLRPSPHRPPVMLNIGGVLGAR